MLIASLLAAARAGLTAAVYLARFRRSTLVIDNNASRAALIPVSHNYPGFVSGISGQELLTQLRQQAIQYGASLEIAEACDVKICRDGGFVVYAAGISVAATKLLLATGVVDEKASSPGIDKFIYQGAVRFCPVCDGFEAMDQRVGVLGPLAQVVKKALFLRTDTKELVLLVTDKNINFTPDDVAALEAANIPIPCEPVVDLITSENTVKATLASGIGVELDILYPAMGAQVRSGLARNLGARVDEQGYLFVDGHQETSVPGLFAAGDVTIELSQISVATGQAAIAATHIHNTLPLNFR